MFYLGVVLVCSSSAGVFLWGSSLPCIDVVCVDLWAFDRGFLPACVPCIWEMLCTTALHIKNRVVHMQTLANVGIPADQYRCM
jgi:hypothetical protein